MDDWDHLVNLTEKVSRIQVALGRLYRRRLERARRDQLGVTNEEERQELDKTITTHLALLAERLAQIEDLLEGPDSPLRPSN